jgi:hypothetical protein
MEMNLENKIIRMIQAVLQIVRSMETSPAVFISFNKVD